MEGITERRRAQACQYYAGRQAAADRRAAAAEERTNEARFGLPDLAMHDVLTAQPGRQYRRQRARPWPRWPRRKAHPHLQQMATERMERFNRQRRERLHHPAKIGSGEKWRKTQVTFPRDMLTRHHFLKKGMKGQLDTRQTRQEKQQPDHLPHWS